MLNWGSRSSGSDQTGRLSGATERIAVEDVGESDDFVMVDFVTGVEHAQQFASQVLPGRPSSQGGPVITEQPRVGVQTSSSTKADISTIKSYHKINTPSAPLTLADIPLWLTSHMMHAVSCHDNTTSQNTSPFLPTQPDLSRFTYDFQLERELTRNETSPRV